MKISTFGRMFLAGFLLCTAGFADSSTPAALRGPVLGYVLDARTHSLRPVNGIPGAAHLGAPMALPFPVLVSAVSSRSDFALVTAGSEDQGLYLVRNLDAQPPPVQSVPGALGGASRIVLNSANSAAALYSAEGRRLQILHGLPDNPSAGPMLDLSLLDGSVTALALDREGSNLLIAVSDGARGALYLMSVLATGEPGDLLQPQARFLSNFATPSAIALLNQDRDAVLADAGTSQLFLIRDFAGDAGIFVLAGERDGISIPVGVETSADGRKVFVAGGGTPGALLVLDLETNLVEIKATLDGAPTRLDRLQGRSTFLLNDVSDDPLLLLDNADTLEIYFVPAGRDE